MTDDTTPVAIQKHDKLYDISFEPDAVTTLVSALKKARRPVNGYAVQAVLLHLAEKDDPEWASDLEFDSEHDLFCVRCTTKLPLERLLRRFEKRIADPRAMRRLVRAVPSSMFDDAFDA